MKESMEEEEEEEKEMMMMMMRSASDKERTKMRERQRRSITTKIFNGLRKHGGYNLPPRSDINDVLRELAREAGWVVEPDGTTYRGPSWFNQNHHHQNNSNNKSSSATSSAPNVVDQHFAHYHSFCLAGKGSRTSTPTSSFGGGGGGGGGGSGECSTTASPGNVQDVLDTTLHGYGSVRSGGGPHTLYLGGPPPNLDLPVVDRFCGDGFPSGGIFDVDGTGQHAPGTVDAAPYTSGMVRMMTRQQFYFSESRASSENSPVDSPYHRPH